MLQKARDLRHLILTSNQMLLLHHYKVFANPQLLLPYLLVHIDAGQRNQMSFGLVPLFRFSRHLQLPYCKLSFVLPLINLKWCRQKIQRHIPPQNQFHI